MKLPAVPVHTWLPDAHTQAPVAGSVDLAGLVLKVGAYGMLRMSCRRCFRLAALGFAPVVMTLAVIGILYGAILAFAQTDLKRLVAYTSVSHMGFVLLGIFAWNTLALQGAVMILLAHGITTGALFILVGIVERAAAHARYGAHGRALGHACRRWAGCWLFFALASLGLPGPGQFHRRIPRAVGDLPGQPGLRLHRRRRLHRLRHLCALDDTTGLFRRASPDRAPSASSSWREKAMMAATIAITLWLGLFPQTVINTAEGALRGLQQSAADASARYRLRSVLPAHRCRRRKRLGYPRPVRRRNTMSRSRSASLLPLIVHRRHGDRAVMLAIAFRRDHRLIVALTLVGLLPSFSYAFVMAPLRASPGDAAVHHRPICALLHRG